MLNRNVIVRRLESLLLLTGLINISPLWWVFLEDTL
jgi:hypothetical protein